MHHLDAGKCGERSGIAFSRSFRSGRLAVDSASKRKFQVCFSHFVGHAGDPLVQRSLTFSTSRYEAAPVSNLNCFRFNGGHNHGEYRGLRGPSGLRASASITGNGRNGGGDSLTNHAMSIFELEKNSDKGRGVFGSPRLYTSCI